jgi:hypothetical protein
MLRTSPRGLPWLSAVSEEEMIRIRTPEGGLEIIQPARSRLQRPRTYARTWKCEKLKKGKHLERVLEVTPLPSSMMSCKTALESSKTRVRR